jgi:transcriptional regulator GlxA family with amidase domain
MSFAPISAFETANFVTGDRFYDIHLVSETGVQVSNSLGRRMDAERLGETSYDTVVVGATVGVLRPSPDIAAFLREAITTTRRIASVCIGAFTLAEAGILDGRRATTHWGYAQELQRRFPKVIVEMDRIFVADGPVWTSAGMTAGIDLALGLIERDMGRDVARATARTLVVHHRRAGGQSQHSAMLELDAKSDRVQTAIAFARKNLREPLTVEQLAEAARLSPRQFSRVFRAETGQSPAQAIENLVSKPRDSCWSKGVCRSERSPARQGSGIGSGCVAVSGGLSGKRRKQWAMLRARLPLSSQSGKAAATRTGLMSPLGDSGANPRRVNRDHCLFSVIDTSVTLVP